MAAASDIISKAFEKVSIYDPTAAQNTTALTSLNNLVSSLGVEFIQPAVVSETLAISQGTAEYTIGSGGDLDTVRPMKIENLRLRNSEDYDYPVSIMSPGDYNRVSSKTFESRPELAYFLPEYPLAKLIFECEPDAAYTAYIESLKPISEFATAATDVSMPPEYKEMLVYNLAISLAEDWNRKVSNTVLKRAEDLKDKIISFIAGTKPPATAKFEFSGGKRFNINIGE